MKHVTKNRTGFTLIEIMVAIAIVGILAAAVLVSMQSFGTKARVSRAMAQAASAIPSMVSCWGNNGNVSTPPSGGTNICDLNASYGQWPALPGGFNYTYNAVVGTTASAFHFSVTGESQTICCNSGMNGCRQVANVADCTNTATW